MSAKKHFRFSDDGLNVEIDLFTKRFKADHNTSNLAAEVSLCRPGLTRTAIQTNNSSQPVSTNTTKQKQRKCLSKSLKFSRDCVETESSCSATSDDDDGDDDLRSKASVSSLNVDDIQKFSKTSANRLYKEKTRCKELTPRRFTSKSTAAQFEKNNESSESVSVTSDSESNNESSESASATSDSESNDIVSATIESEDSNSSDSSNGDDMLHQGKFNVKCSKKKLDETGSVCAADMKSRDSGKKQRSALKVDKSEDVVRNALITTINQCDTPPGDERALLRQELANLPFKELEELKQKVGMKVFREVMYPQLKTPTTKNVNRTFRRENKNRPMEMSSKKPVGRLRQIVPVKKRVTRDPRFDDLSGEYNETFFNKSYSFLADIKSREKQALQKEMETEEDELKRAQLKKLISKMTQQDKLQQEAETKKQKDREWKKQEMQMVAQGKRPYFPKKSEMKLQQLSEKYENLKQAGKLHNFLQKKRKQNSAKERRKLPAMFDK